MTDYIYCLKNTVSIAVYGPFRPKNTRLLALQYGADKNHICLMKAASTKNDQGFQEMAPARFGSPLDDSYDIYADSTMVNQPGSAIITWNADCPIAIFLNEDEKGGKTMAMAHAGRAAMTPNQDSGLYENIITKTYYDLVADSQWPNVSVYIVGAMCGHCFVHEGPNDEELIEPFDLFGEIAFTDRKRGALDLVSIIKHQLIGFGVNPDNIKHDNVCTKETLDLASYRRDGSPARNAIVAVLH